MILFMFRRFSDGGGTGLSHSVPKFLVIDSDRRRTSDVRLFRRGPLMHTLRLHKTGLLRQLTTPTPGCAHRVIHQSAIGK